MGIAPLRPSCGLICPDPGNPNPGIWAAANQRDGQITSDFQKSCQAPFAKIFCFAPDPNQFTDSHCPVPQEGRSRVVTSAGRDAVDVRASGAHWQSQGEMNLVSGLAGVQDDRRFSGRRSRVVLTPQGWRQVSWRFCRPNRVSARPSIRGTTVATKPGHRGEREVSRKTIARGMSVDPSEPVVTTLVCFVFFGTRGCGCRRHPAFPAPSVVRGANGSCKTSGDQRRGIADVCRLSGAGSVAE
jgi:hypothetical protein